MTIKELKQLIENVSDDFQVCIEYDGPETVVDLPVSCIYISTERENVVFISEEKK